MIVVCMGYADKRPILYSLMKLLQSFGDVAVITQNRQLRRLLYTNSLSGHFNNIFVAISDSAPDEVFADTGCKPEDFDHIIFDNVDTLPAQYDICISCSSYGLTDADWDIIEHIEGIVKYNFMYNEKVDRDCINIPVTFNLLKSVEEFEARRLLSPIDSKALLTGLAKLTAPLLKITEKNAIRILKKGWRER